MTLKNSFNNETSSAIRLAQLKAGESGQILALNIPNPDLLTELLESGLLPGQIVFCQNSIAKLEQLVLQLGAVKLGIRWSDANSILVKRIPTQ